MSSKKIIASLAAAAVLVTGYSAYKVSNIMQDQAIRSANNKYQTLTNSIVNFQWDTEMDAGKKGAPSPTEQEFCLKEGVWLGKTSGMDLITFENNGTVIGQGYVVDQCSVKSKEKMTLRQAVTIARELNSTAYDATIASYHHSLYPKDTNSVKGSDSYPYSDAHKIHGRPSVKAKQIAILTP